MAKTEKKDSGDSAEPKRNSLIQAVSDNDMAKALEVLSDSATAPSINCTDENGMSPLQHACFLGNAPMARMLIERGADVNQNDHEHRYTGLMFAALGGHTEVVNLMLEHGADVHAINRVGRNASQMAAFVGQHQSVAAINNYIPRELIEQYGKVTAGNGESAEPRLPFRFIPAVHSFVCIVNINPVRIAFFLSANWTLFEVAKKISNTLEHLCGTLFKSKEPNEMLSLKMHYLNFLFDQINRTLVANLAGDETITQDAVKRATETMAALWLKPNANGFAETLDRTVREAIRSYPYQENSLFQQLVRTLSTIAIGDEPSALAVLSQAILGKAIGTEETNTCFACSEIKPKKRCSRCKFATYCDQVCQRLHWPLHKRFCTRATESAATAATSAPPNVTAENPDEKGENQSTESIS